MEKKRVFVIIDILAVLVIVAGVLATIYSMEGSFYRKIQDYLYLKNVELTNDNFFATGFLGILEDVNEVQKLPDELYLAKPFTVKVNKVGSIQSIDAFVYGEESKLYSIDFDSSKGNSISLYISIFPPEDYSDDKKLSNLASILDMETVKSQVESMCEEYSTNSVTINFTGDSLEITPNT